MSEVSEALRSLLDNTPTEEAFCKIRMGFQNGVLTTMRVGHSTRVPAAPRVGRQKISSGEAQSRLDRVVSHAKRVARFGKIEIEFVLINGEIFDWHVEDEDVIKVAKDN